MEKHETITIIDYSGIYDDDATRLTFTEITLGGIMLLCCAVRDMFSNEQF